MTKTITKKIDMLKQLNYSVGGQKLTLWLFVISVNALGN